MRLPSNPVADAVTQTANQVVAAAAAVVEAVLETAIDGTSEVLTYRGLDRQKERISRFDDETRAARDSIRNEAILLLAENARRFQREAEAALEQAAEPYRGVFVAMVLVGVAVLLVVVSSTAEVLTSPGRVILAVGEVSMAIARHAVERGKTTAEKSVERGRQDVKRLNTELGGLLLSIQQLRNRQSAEMGRNSETRGRRDQTLANFEQVIRMFKEALNAVGPQTEGQQCGKMSGPALMTLDQSARKLQRFFIRKGALDTATRGGWRR